MRAAGAAVNLTRRGSVASGACPVCGEHQAFLDLADGDHVAHVCGTPAMGGTWWVTKAAPGRARRRRAA